MHFFLFDTVDETLTTIRVQPTSAKQNVACMCVWHCWQWFLASFD